MPSSTVIPARIARLEELAYNLWWSWYEPARQMFRALDYSQWRLSGHNPVKQLSSISKERFADVAADPAFLTMYDTAIAAFDADIKKPHTWFTTNCSSLGAGPVAYFSMEYAIHNSLPIYAGGLGILAGDICKEASDLGIPMVAVGFMFPQGYFHQQLCNTPNQCQLEIYRTLDFNEAPITRLLAPNGGKAITRVKLRNVILGIGVWLVKAGRTNVYLLDTTIEENPEPYRQLSSRLYVADREIRIQQEIILGIGGVRVLRALGVNPIVWHGNEGHTSFMMLERTREEVLKGKNFPEAADIVRAGTVFTGHTPVMAGHDIFTESMVDSYFNGYWQSLGIDRQTFMGLGLYGNNPQDFNMTALALKMAGQSSAVSELHGKVARKMWNPLWPEKPEDKVPIEYVTNGVHVPTWIAAELNYTFTKYLGTDWLARQDDPDLWKRIDEIPEEEIWTCHQRLKLKLLGAVLNRMRGRWLDGNVNGNQMMSMGALFDPQALTIAFARRFTEYKRPDLLFRDAERLKRILTDPLHPVQLVFAGKSHPADFASKYLLQKVYDLANDPKFQGRIMFIEDYDMHAAHYLVHGADIWLNMPRRLQEASGTSGMKAAINGVINLSVRDGWWNEGYNGSNGWAIGDGPDNFRADEEDARDTASLYDLLEKVIVPLYYQREANGVPRDWVRMMKRSISSVLPAFSARRMVKEYASRMYVAAARK
ncbi:MAG: alpha-glucan family phosphorylase [Dehalococcoidales bacterium]|nr:alpha-glucan family phosphorylase [Dehalococcoidales bacterium]